MFRPPHLHGLTAPAQERLGEPCAAVTVLQRPLRRKRPSGGTRHLRGREAQVLHLTGCECGRRKWMPETHGKSCSPTQVVVRWRAHRGRQYITVLLFPEIALKALQGLGTSYVLLDTFYGDVDAIRQHEASWRMLTTLAEKVVDLQRVFPAHYGKRRTISEGYWNFALFCSHYKFSL